MKQFFAYFDTFGVPLSLKFQSKKQVFKSYVGGILSLGIYSVSIFYLIYVFKEWQNDQMSPKMFSSRVISTFEYLNLDYNVISVEFLKVGQRSFIDPFQQQNNIITPLLFSANINGSVNVKSLLTSITEGKTSSGIAIEIKSAINQFLPSGIPNDFSQKTILFVKCQQEYLLKNQSCASNDLIQQYFQSQNNILQIQVNQILLDNRNEPVKTPQQYTFYFESSFIYNINIDLNTNLYSVNKNLISSKFNFVEYISGSTIYGQSNSIELGKRLYKGLTPYASIYVNLQSRQNQIIIQYPQLGELLAQIGSILSVLFIVKYIIFEINRILLEKAVLAEIISFYYPQFDFVKIKYNCFNQIKSATFKDAPLNLNQFKESYYKLLQKAENKVSFNNILYEQSRLYMILRSMKNQSELRESHDMGIDLNSSIQSTPYFVTAKYTRTGSQILNLDDQDFDLISLNHKKDFVEIINDEPMSVDDACSRMNSQRRISQLYNMPWRNSIRNQQEISLEPQISNSNELQRNIQN